MEAVMMREDLKCAEEAGVQALESLYTVREKLNSAKKWGILDIFGGKHDQHLYETFSNQ